MPEEPVVTSCLCPAVRPVCPCQGNGQQPPALLMRFWSPSSPPASNQTTVLLKATEPWLCELSFVLCPVKLTESPSVVSLRLDWLRVSTDNCFFCHTKDPDDKINSVMPKYRAFQTGSEALIGCLFTVLAF